MRLPAALLLVMLLPACTSKLFTPPARAQAEAEYAELWQSNWESINQVDAQLGACSSGGTTQGCFDASNLMIDALRRFRAELDNAAVPSRYAEADSGVKEALKLLIEGFTLRNEGIAENSDPKFVDGNRRLREANDELAAAYERFPSDNRPQPAIAPPASPEPDAR